MTSLTLSRTPPLFSRIKALSSPIKWGSYLPPESATYHDRLRCILLDFLTSDHLPSLPHEQGPYFKSKKPYCCFAKTFDIANKDESEPFFMTRLDKVTAVKFLYFCILTYCEAPEKNSNLYVFEAKVYALDKDMKPLRHTTLLSLFENLQPLECKLGVKWLIKHEWLAHGMEDVIASIDWDVLAAIFQHHAKIRFGKDGEPLSELEYDLLVEETPNPLERFGLLGWPTVVDGVPTLIKRA